MKARTASAAASPRCPRTRAARRGLRRGVEPRREHGTERERAVEVVGVLGRAAVVGEQQQPDPDLRDEQRLRRATSRCAAERPAPRPRQYEQATDERRDARTPRSALPTDPERAPPAHREGTRSCATGAAARPVPTMRPSAAGAPCTRDRRRAPPRAASRALPPQTPRHPEPPRSTSRATCSVAPSVETAIKQPARPARPTTQPSPYSVRSVGRVYGAARAAARGLGRRDADAVRRPRDRGLLLCDRRRQSPRRPRPARRRSRLRSSR